MPSCRPAAVAGAFYPADATQLSQELDQLLAAFPLQDAPQPKAIIAPHAGYIYSGSTAASIYARLRPFRASIRRVVLLGPCHRVAVAGLAQPSVDAFHTPLGNIPIDHSALARLNGLAGLETNDAAHAQEHSLEVHLPFLQRTLDDFQLIPLAVGHAPPELIADALDRLWGGPETLIVVSTDLSHFHPYASAQTLDQATAQQILRLEGGLQPQQACGAYPVNGLLLAARRHGLRIEQTGLCNSGDTAGDKQRVVGYAAFALTPPPPSSNAQLGAVLLQLGRAAIQGLFDGRQVTVPNLPELHAPGASFVTLTQQGRLRGCIGSLAAHRPLLNDVFENARAAAQRDPRFPPLTAEELAHTRVEVSLLTPAVAMSFVDQADALSQLRPLIDGIIFSAGQHRATFLPQVWEQLTDPATFMAHLKQKAGLPADYWGPEVKLERYTVNKWKEAQA